MADIGGHLVYKGFEAWVVMGDKSLPHFGVEYKESTGEVSAWIPSEAGQSFAIYYCKPGHDDCSYTTNLELDGHKIRSVIFVKELAMDTSSVRSFSWIRISPTEIRDFVFNPAVLTDDDAYMDHPLSAGMGEIKVVFQLAEGVCRNMTPSCINPISPLSEMQKIHERSKKGLVHQIQFSGIKVMPYQSRATYNSKPIGSPVTFIFKYRSLNMLQANGIAPYPNPPVEAPKDAPSDSQTPVKNAGSPISQHGTAAVKLEDEDDDDDDDEDGDEDEDEEKEIIKMRTLLAELEERRNQKRVRKEFGRPSNKVKAEYVNPFKPGEIIDLTEPNDIRPQKKVKTESTSHFAHGEVIDLT